MARILCVRLFGPMASWGTPDSGAAVRDTARHPSRGAILGMAAAALGIGREDNDGLAALGASVVTAVASHGQRRVKADFRTVQTVEGGKRTKPFASRADALANGLHVHTTTTQRFHIEDGLWRVFLAEREGAGPRFTAASLKDAFARPAFELYLGRREFPLALPPDPFVLDGDLAGALKAYPAVPVTPKGKECRELGNAMRSLDRRLVRDGEFDLCWEAAFSGAPTAGRRRPVLDDPGSRVAWRFGEREERYATGLMPLSGPTPPSVSLANEFFA
jgi:CRISPR system Cascade subunit CasD